MRLVLGCGHKPEAGAVNHDYRKHSSAVDVAHDLREIPWPWADGEFDDIYACMVLEHLPEVLPFFDECHRILEPGGVLTVIVPHYQSENVVIDPTHYRGFHILSMDIFDPSTDIGQKAMHYTDRKWAVTERKHGIKIDHEALRFRLVTI